MRITGSNMAARRSKYLGDTPCSADGCTRLADHGGSYGKLCDTHYQRIVRRGTLDPYESKGVSKDPEYKHWLNMKSRCNTPSSTGWEHYGGRGIKVSPDWDDSYEKFLSDVGRRPTPKHSLDRIDVNGNYEPGNVRWATQTTQMRNMRLNRIVKVGGKEITLAQAVESSSLLYNTILYRLKRGWSLDDALSYPARKGVRPEKNGKA